ncbi:MAG: hypothetical protein HKN25_09115 [Pyrinomonadaceae bacterium]|nr:hypothetical protein [Pyrinomonadaceae bacterium]
MSVQESKNNLVSMLRTSALLAVFCCLGFAAPTTADSDVKGQKSTPPMWGDLNPGKFDVGFRTVFAYDRSRPSIPYSDWGGKLYPSNETEGRQMQINIWYPAKVTKKDARLKFQHYLDLTAQQTDFGKIDEQKRKFAEQQYIAKTNALGGGNTFTAEKLRLLTRLETHAYPNPRPIDQKFPLIVFPNGGSPAFQSIMCEFFASHGFVVAAVALKGQHAFTNGASLRGVETAVQDLDFTVGKVLEIRQVDRTKICLIGNAISSSQSIAYQSRNPNITCVVSLEGGLLSEFEQKILRRTAFYDEQSVDIPILAIYAPHPAIDPKNIYHLKYSDRYFLHFPKMTEFHFLNYGVFERFVPNIIGKPKGDVQKGFELAALYSLRFFEANLLNNKQSAGFLRQKPSESGHIDRHFVKEALPVPQNITNLKNAFTKDGITYIERVYYKHKKRDPTPFSREFFNDFKDWLAWKKDPKYENRFRLYKLALESYANSATINYYFAYFALKTERKGVSKEHFRKALELLKTDKSPELTSDRKAQMKEFIKKSLEELNKS